ncbi:MAG TPA: zinc-binding dehydrogenase [Cyclobacteriaceae bacterium]|nr:zinc-binding dehydrogenase [Cyclobacteriaceae bacterium]
MKAFVFRGSQHPTTIEDVAKPKPVRDQLLIKLKYCALNHRDLWILNEQNNVTNPAGIILGSDGSGVVEMVGEDADPSWIGAEVIINPSLEWGDNPVVNGNSFKILGFPDHGTFAEYIVIAKKYVFEKPENLTLEESAAIPLSGLTAYRALFSKARLRAKEKVLIVGAGGAVAQIALQYASAYQARVYVTSGSDQKIQQSKSLGAVEGYNYKDQEWVQKALKEAGGFDIIIDTAGGRDFQKLIDLALPGGRIVNFGRTAGNIGEINTRQLYSKQLSIFGTTMGTRDEFLSMIDFFESRKIKPVIDQVMPFSKIHNAIKRMESSEQFGKIVLKIQE